MEIVTVGLATFSGAAWLAFNRPAAFDRLFVGAAKSAQFFSMFLLGTATGTLATKYLSSDVYEYATLWVMGIGALALIAIFLLAALANPGE